MVTKPERYARSINPCSVLAKIFMVTKLPSGSTSGDAGSVLAKIFMVTKHDLPF